MSISPDGVSDVPWNKAFSNVRSMIKEVHIDDGITTICDYAFYKNTSLQEVTIPGSVTGIGNSAFSNCSSLTAVDLPNSLTSIGLAAFYKCKALNSLTIPGSVKSVGRDAFEYCYDLKTIIFSGSLSKIPGNIPVDTIIVSDDAIRSGEKIDPKVAKNINNQNGNYSVSKNY